MGNWRLNTSNKVNREARVGGNTEETWAVAYTNVACDIEAVA